MLDDPPLPATNGIPPNRINTEFSEAKRKYEIVASMANDYLDLLSKIYKGEQKTLQQGYAKERSVTIENFYLQHLKKAE
jgi:hypothetical protein